MKILVLASDNPSPPINGTRIRNFHLWPEIRKAGHNVKILSLTRNKDDIKKNSSDIEFFMFTRKNIFIRIWMRLFHSYHEWPISEDLKKRVIELIREWGPDVIHCEELRMGFYLPNLLRDKKITHSLCVHNVESLLIKKTLASPFNFGIKIFNFVYTYNLKKFEKKIFKKTDIIFSYSKIDGDIYKNLYPEFNWQITSNGVNAIDIKDSELQHPDSRRILFLGSLSYLPNTEGLFWFIDKVLPKINNHASLNVAGSTPTNIVKEKLQKHSIPLMDTPLDLNSAYVHNSVLIVPILNGSGTRGKILEALMYGKGVITTSKGIEGLDIANGEGVLIADSAEEFASSVDFWIGLSDEERLAIVEKGKSIVELNYTWKKVGENLLNSWSLITAKTHSEKNL